MSNLLLSLTQKKKDFQIPPFKINNKELKANIDRIDKGIESYFDVEVSKPMSKTPPSLKKDMNLFSLVIIVILSVILGQIVQS